MNQHQRYESLSVQNEDDTSRRLYWSEDFYIHFSESASNVRLHFLTTTAPGQAGVMLSLSTTTPMGRALSSLGDEEGLWRNYLDGKYSAFGWQVHEARSYYLQSPQLVRPRAQDWLFPDFTNGDYRDGLPLFQPTAFWLCAVTMVYGGIHLTAWTSHFQTFAEAFVGHVCRYSDGDCCHLYLDLFHCPPSTTGRAGPENGRQTRQLHNFVLRRCCNSVLLLLPHLPGRRVLHPAPFSPHRRLCSGKHTPNFQSALDPQNTDDLLVQIPWADYIPHL